MQDFVHFKGKEIILWGFPGGSAVKNLPVNAGDTVRQDTDSIPGSRRSPRKGNGNQLQDSCPENIMEPGRLQSMGSQRVGHNLATEQQQSNLISTHTEGEYRRHICNILETCLIGREIPFHGMLRSTYVTNQGSCPSPINRNRLEARQEIQTKLFWGPGCNKWDQEQTSSPCSLAS